METEITVTTIAAPIDDKRETMKQSPILVLLILITSAPLLIAEDYDGYDNRKHHHRKFHDNTESKGAVGGAITGAFVGGAVAGPVGLFVGGAAGAAGGAGIGHSVRRRRERRENRDRE